MLLKATPPRPKILVVDDNDANLMVMRKLLGKLPCDVVAARSGNEALAACVREDFALMLLDIEMPDMDGYEVAELLKDDPTTRGIPIVFVSATPSDQVSRLRAYSVGAVDYIEKPLEELVLLAKARMFLDLHSAKQRLELELKRSEAMRDAARESGDRYHQALDGAPIPVMVHAEDGEIILVNRIWKELTGYKESDILSIAAWTANAYGSQAPEMARQFARLYGCAGVVHQGEHVVLTAHGTHLIWNVRSTPLPPLPDGRRVIASMAEDITAYRRAMRGQEDARQVALQADRAKGEFLANMSHEIRTPMNAIVGLTQLALETDLTPRQRDYLSKISSASTALLGLINDILDYSKIEAGRLELERIPFFLEEVLNDTAQLFLPVVEQKGLELFLEVAKDTPLSLVGDPLRLGQVLNNLVGNAVKFTNAGEIHVRVEPADLDGDQVTLKISVRDTGIGLAKEQLDRLFRPFIQADGSTTRRYGGTGLGLTISRHLVGLMDGQINVSSSCGDGSTFAFTARFGLGRERRNLAHSHHLHGLRALVVDDQETSLAILRDMLGAWAGDIVTMSSGEGVVAEIERAEAAGRPFELVLLDWCMPGLNGVDVARRINEEAELGRIKRPPMVLMVTAYSKDRMLEEAGAVPLDGFLTKPVTPSHLLDAIIGVRDPSLARRSRDTHRPQATPYDMARPIAGAHVLVVEDNSINQEVAREFLEKAGLRVSLANDGREGIDAVRRTRFDAVLMDMQMPVIDGLEATRVIRAMPEGRGLPIIAMTAAAMPQDKQACADAGMDDHISKPIVPKDLLATLVHWIGKKRPAAFTPMPMPMPMPMAEEARDDAFPDIPGIEARQASVRLAGNKTLFLSLLEQTTRSFEGVVAEVRQFLASGDREQAARRLHALRGAAGNVSANLVAQLATEAEAVIKDQRNGDLAPLLERLEASLATLFTEIRAFLSNGGSTVAPNGQLQPGDLAGLCEALNARDAEALGQFDRLFPAISARYGAHVARDLRSAIDSLRFHEAAGLLSQIGTMP